MKPTLKLIISILLIATLNACVYLDTKVPLDTDVSTTTLGTKTGSSAVHSVLWLVSWGDGGTQAAAKNGGITTINHLDSRVQMYLFGAYTKVETIAYGN